MGLLCCVFDWFAGFGWVYFVFGLDCFCGFDLSWLLAGCVCVGLLFSWLLNNFVFGICYMVILSTFHFI